MAIDYKRELEDAAKGMILVHDPDTLIRMIVRSIVQKVKISHASILLTDKESDSYILTVSRGPTGLRVPSGFARMDRDNPLIRFFGERKDKELLNDGALIYLQGKTLLRKHIGAATKQLLKQALYQMEIFDARVCIASFFRNELLGLLLLGNKKNNKEFRREEIDFFVALASTVSMAIRNAQLYKDRELELEKKHRLFIHTILSLTATIDAKDNYTGGHTARVTDLSMAIAKKLAQNNKKEFDAKFLEHLYIASVLHDIGKIGIPERILNKEGPLNESERKHMLEHTLKGVAILQHIKELEDALLGVKYHHERYDGTGYPEGLAGDQIPLVAAIISVADAFDAMVTDRPYRRALSKTEAVEEIKRQCGKQFSPQIATAFVELFQEGKI